MSDGALVDQPPAVDGLSQNFKQTLFDAFLLMSPHQADQLTWGEFGRTDFERLLPVYPRDITNILEAAIRRFGEKLLNDSPENSFDNVSNRIDVFLILINRFEETLKPLRGCDLLDIVYRQLFKVSADIYKNLYGMHGPHGDIEIELPYELKQVFENIFNITPKVADQARYYRNGLQREGNNFCLLPEDLQSQMARFIIYYVRANNIDDPKIIGKLRYDLLGFLPENEKAHHHVFLKILRCRREDAAWKKLKDKYSPRGQQFFDGTSEYHDFADMTDVEWDMLHAKHLLANRIKNRAVKYGKGLRSEKRRAIDIKDIEEPPINRVEHFIDLHGRSIKAEGKNKKKKKTPPMLVYG